MRNLMRLFGCVPVSVAVLAMFVPGATAADTRGRAAYVNENVHGRDGGTTARMPTMPVMPMNNLGNVMGNMPNPNAPSVPDVPDTPDEPDDTPDIPDEPDTPATECPDGGVKNSTYTVENCMDDILRCVNTGALAGGLNDLFNEDLRSAIVNGMGLCSAQVDKCIADVRRDCTNVYRAPADVWIDFNARRIQPEYYNFVLRRTGLTPNQAENTCMLLDRNTYGASFNAVSNAGGVTAEYNNTVGAYNSQNGNALVKNNPLGVSVNGADDTVDGARGYYARWDATTAQCHIRVAAYNKDNQITNSWLFGAAGTDEPAQVWRLAGDTFTCNKEMFGFSLMNQTNTAALVGVGGGTLLGAGIGAAAGHGARDIDCNNVSHRRDMATQLRSVGNVGILNEFLEADNQVSTVDDTVTLTQCKDIVDLYNVYRQLKTAISKCDATSTYSYDQTITETGKIVNGKVVEENIDVQTTQDIVGNPECVFKAINIAKRDGTGIYCDASESCRAASDIRVDVARLGRVLDNVTILAGEKSNMGKSIGIGAAVGAGTGGLATAITAFVESSNITCRVGDGLATVGLGKSYSIGSLKDFYVKWNLQVPDTVAPTAMVTDCNSWKQTCDMFKDLNQCAVAQINYKPAGAKTTTLIRSACRVSGSTCIENYPVAKSFGACK